MKRLSFSVILLLAVVGFFLQPTRGKSVPVDLSVLRGFPLTLGSFRAVSDNNAQLLNITQLTDGSEGLERDYIDSAGRRFYVYLAPQTIGQHAPIMCYRYGGFSILSETRQAVSGHPEIGFNRMVAREDSGQEVSACAYYWKTASGLFVPKPNHSLGLIATRWSDHQQGILVEICSRGEDVNAPGTEQALEELVRDSYPEVARLYPAVFTSLTNH